MFARGFALSAVLVLALCGCGGGSTGTPAAVPQPGGAAAGQTGTLNFTIEIPSRSAAEARAKSGIRYKSYISPFTSSVVVRVNGNATAFNASGPVINVTLPGLPLGPAQFFVDAYDGPSGTGNLLSVGRGSTLVTPGPNIVAVALNGVPAALNVSLSVPNPPLSTTPLPIGVTVSATDADGGAISGPLTAPITLNSPDQMNAPISPSTLTASPGSAVLTYSGACTPPLSVTASTGGAAGAAVLGTNRHAITVAGSDAASAGTLRYWILNAASTDLVVNAVPSNTITLGSALPPIANTLTICGGAPGSPLNFQIDGGGANSAFAVQGGGHLNLVDLTVQHTNSATQGPALTVNAGGTVNLDGVLMRANNATMSGGAIASAGSLTVTRSQLSNNGSGIGGGAISVSSGTTTIDRSSLIGNSAAAGGAIYITSGGATIKNSTIASNMATSTGGGIQVGGTAMLTVQFSTVVANNGGSYGGNVYSSIPLLSSTASIYAAGIATTYPDVYATITSGGHNIVQNPAGASGLVGTDLIANPQSTAQVSINNLTVAKPTLTSPADDTVPFVLCPPFDELNVPRPSPSCTIGAVEP